MKCLVCGEYFNEPRYLKDLFRVKKYYICQRCYLAYPIEIEYSIIPLGIYSLTITSLFNGKQKFNYTGYIIEYSRIYEKILLECKESLVLMYDHFLLKEELLEELTHISRLLDKGIVVLTNIYIV